MAKARAIDPQSIASSKRLKLLSKIATDARNNNRLDELVETATNPNLAIKEIMIRIAAISRVQELVVIGRKLTPRMLEKISRLVGDEKNFPVKTGDRYTRQHNRWLRHLASSLVRSLPFKPARRAG